MKYFQLFLETFCIIGKSTMNDLPHIISCSIGISNLKSAKVYSKQMSMQKNLCDKRVPMYEWTKPMPFDEAWQQAKEGKLFIAKNDGHWLQQEVEEKAAMQ